MTANKVVWKLFIGILLLCLSMPVYPDSSSVAPEYLKAFPDAQGAGAGSQGGRGGRVLIVDRLDDPCPDQDCTSAALNDPSRLTPGTLRWALKQPYPRIIVFNVSGIIRLQPDDIRKINGRYHTTPRGIVISDPYVTIAGHTAPAGGITIANNGLHIETHDVIMRFISLRTGRHTYTKIRNQQNPETLTLGIGARRVVINHCSLSWMPTEALGIYTGQRWDGKQGTARDITLSHNLIAEGLVQDEAGYGHPSGGFMVGFDGDDDSLAPDNISFHHNLLMHSQKRNGLLQGRRIQFVNNLVYNWQWLPTVLVGAVQADLIANHWKPGPLTSYDSKTRTPIHWVPDARDLGVNDVDGWWHGISGQPSIYLAGNSSQPHPHRAFPNPDQQALLCSYQNRDQPCQATFPNALRTQAQQLSYPITVIPVQQLHASLLPIIGNAMRLDQNGRWQMNRDAIDQRYVSEYRQGTYINERFPWHEKQVGGYGEQPVKYHPADYDQDRDGMPDKWEKLHGLDPTQNDAALDKNGDGYTNIEAFINGMLP